MKYLKKILFLFFLLIIFIPNVKANEKNLVNIYLFHSDTCPHCQEEIKLLTELKKEYDNIKIYKYEIHEGDNKNLLFQVTDIFNTPATNVPFTVIGNKTFTGFNYENSKKAFKSVIEYYSNYGYEDKVGELIGNIELPKYEILDTDPNIDKYIDNYGNYTFTLPLIGRVQTKNLTLPIISVVIGLVDGFNPCAMWVLLFLISMLIGMKDKKRMWTLGVTFLVASALIYLIFMLAWLNIASIITEITVVRIVIAIVAVLGGLINLKGCFKSKDDGCNVVDDKKRKKVFSKIKKFTQEKNFALAILGVVALAVSVNIIELACSAGLPVMFIEILSLNNLTSFEYGVYIAIYILFFLLDDLIVFIIAMTTLKLTGISTKYGKISKLIGGIFLLLIGILLIIKPEWLMFNFK